MTKNCYYSKFFIDYVIKFLFQKTKPIEAAPTSFRNGQPDAPFFLGLKPFKDRVAITATNGDFTYADLFNR